jgi:hypothetical protein
MQVTASKPISLNHQEASQTKALQPGFPIVWIGLLICAASVWFLDRPPHPLAEQVPSSVFSAARAAEYLAVIARAPHPINSPEHDAVRDYIVRTLQNVGLTPEIQKTTDINESRKIPGALYNIVCRIKGTGTGKAVLVAGHYDSVPAGPGASDDGVAVASMLETVQSLKSAPQLKRDVIFLFTDGEERGLLGARAFVSEHPWAHDVGVVLNFEARGTSGPSIMFETSDHNGWLIRNFSQAASDPVANSLSYEIYKRLPGNTDFTIFRRAGYPGLNFAFIDGFAYYHSPHDSPENANRGSIQQHGNYMLALVRQFGNAESDDPRPANVIYFDLLGKLLVVYGPTAATVFLALTIILAAVAVFFGLRTKRLRAGASLVGLITVLGGTVITLLVSQVLARMIMPAKPHPSRTDLGPIPEAGWYVASFCAVGLGCGIAFYLLISKRISAENLTIGSFLVWIGLVIAVAIFLPGGTYLFLWPLFFSALAWLAVFASRQMSPRTARGILFLGSLPAIVIVVPMIHKIYSAFAAGATAMVSGLFAVVVSLLIGPIALDTTSRWWMLPACCWIAGLGFLVTAILTA